MTMDENAAEAGRESNRCQGLTSALGVNGHKVLSARLILNESLPSYQCLAFFTAGIIDKDGPILSFEHE